MAAAIPEAAAAAGRAGESTYEAFPGGGGRGSAMPAGLPGGRGPRGPQSKAARLALAIALLWLAGFCFYIAFAATHSLKVSGSDVKSMGGPQALLNAFGNRLSGGYTTNSSNGSGN